MSAISTLDDQTAEAIRQAIGAASRGLHVEACQIGERALAAGGDVTALNAMLGMLRCQSGQVDVGIGHLRIAHQTRPADQRIAINLTNALASAGHHQEALELMTLELARTDPTRHLLRLRGFLAQQAGDYQASIQAYEEVLSTAPADIESWNNLGNARRSAGDFEGSIQALRRAADSAPDSAPIRLNLATALIHFGDWGAAEAELRQMALDFPDDPNPWRELHGLLKEMGRN